MRRVAVFLLLVAAVIASAQSIVQFLTPRAAAEHFVRAAAEERWDDAAQAFDVSESDPTRRAWTGRAAARDVAFLLDSMRFDPASLPDEQFAEPILLNRITGPDGAVIGEIVIGRKEGGWVFTAETVLNSAAMAAAVRAAEAEAGKDEGVTSAAPGPLRSPRATLSTFFNAMNEKRVGEAVATLDLSEISQVTRNERGIQLANRLAAILNRTQYFVESTIPENPPGDVYSLATYRDAKGVVIGEIRIVKGEDEAWRFSAESLASLNRIWDEVQSRPVIAGLQDVDLTDQDPSAKIRAISPSSWMAPAFGGLAWWQVIWFGIFAVSAAILGLLARALMHWLLRLKLKYEFDAIPERIIRRSGFSLSLLVASLLLRRGATLLGFYGWLSSGVLVMTEILAGIGTVGVLWGIWESSVILISRRLSGRSKRVNSLFIPVLRQFGLLIIAASIVLYTISRLGVNVTGVIAGLGIGGAILALAAKDSVENLFGSVTILFEAPFAIGDWVKVDNVEGTVEEITLRSTRIRTFSDSIVVLPNRTLTTSPVENFGRRRYRRFKTVIGVTYATTPDKMSAFTERIRDYLGERADIWQERRRVWFHDLDASSLNILLDTYIIAETFDAELATRDEILRFIMRLAEEMGVDFAFPTQTLIMQRQKAADAPRIE